MSSQWHLDPELAGQYSDGRLSPIATSSVEQHVTECGQCQELVSSHADPARLDRVWTQVLDRVEAPRPTLLERLLRAMRIADDTARLVAATPSLKGSWFTGVVLVLALAVATAHSGTHGIAVFLALAPVLPMLGVAVAFAPGTDPMYEITAASPYSAVRLLAVRGAVVIASTVCLATLAALFLPGSAWVTVAWLLPALALTCLTLLLATRFDPLISAIALALGWIAVVLPGLARRGDPLLATEPTVQIFSALALAFALGLFFVRRDHLPEMFRRIS